MALQLGRKALYWGKAHFVFLLTWHLHGKNLAPKKLGPSQEIGSTWSGDPIQELGPNSFPTLMAHLTINWANLALGPGPNIKWQCRYVTQFHLVVQLLPHDQVVGSLNLFLSANSSSLPLQVYILISQVGCFRIKWSRRLWAWFISLRNIDRKQ